MPKTILIIDDEPDLVKLLDYHLTRSDYAVISARDGESGFAMARKHLPDLIILDVMMPGADGFDVCRRLRAEPATARVPLLMLTARAEESDRILGLELGADDYVTKPFSVREIVARVKALLRRAEVASEPGDVVRVGKLVIDAGRRTVMLGAKPITLTLTEFNILKALAERRGRVLSREDLITIARGEHVAVIDRTIDVHIVALRRKLGTTGDLIETVRGVGYRLKE
jgi:DNA-binding response OmpR family regulator